MSYKNDFKEERKEHARDESIERWKAKEKQMLAEGKKLYSVDIESECKIKSQNSFNVRLFHGWFWALTKEKAGEMALKRSLLEGHEKPTIQSIRVLKEAKKHG